jgi:hypothetical protein
MATPAASARAANTLIRFLLPAFDVSLAGLRNEQVLVAGLSVYGIDYYKEAWKLADRYPDAAAGLLRSLLDLAILVKWIEGSPRLRVRLFYADDDLNRLRLADDYDMIRVARGYATITPAPFSHRERWRILRRAELLRHVAARRGERVNTAPGRPLLPDIRTRAELVGDGLEVAYLFRFISTMVHTTGRALGSDTIEMRPTGPHVKRGRPVAPDMIRGLAVPAICFLLASASRQLNLGLEAEMDRIRLTQTVWRPLPGVPTT